ncbi:hypothetical protein TNCV_56811 [Trichonephila clavipes]|nr:hypothetical protein TNCV_56811 [Trichonephila clavipes]
MFKHSETCKQGVVILKHWTLCRRESLKMMCESASIMITNDYSPQDNERHRFTGRYCAPHRIPAHVSRLEADSQHEMLLPVFARRTHVRWCGIM